MKNIFIGFIFIFLDFNLNIGNSKIGLIPDFVGYLLMMNGLIEMAEESPLFMKVKSFIPSMVIYTGVLYFLDLLGLSPLLGAFSYVLAIISTALSLYISYNIVMAVIELEVKYSRPLNGSSLKSTWTLLAVFNILTFVTLLIPIVTIVCIIVTLIVNICFLVAFSSSRNLYYDKSMN